MFLVDVHFEHGEGHEDNSTMDAPGGGMTKSWVTATSHLWNGRGGRIILSMVGPWLNQFNLFHINGRVKDKEYDTGILGITHR